VRRLVLTVVAAGTLGACTDANVIRLVGERDGGADAGPTVDAGCGRKPPERPMGAPGEGPDRFFMLRDFDVFRGDAWRTSGWDLDDLCTTDATEGPVECQPPASRGAGHVLDGEDGIDDAFGAVIAPALSTVFSGFEEDVAELQSVGRYTLIARVRGWNGMADDDRVEVALSQGVCATAIGEPACTDEAPGSATWDGSGTDVLYPADVAFVGGDPEMPRFEDRTSYVAGRKLVMHIPPGVTFDVAGDVRALVVSLTDGVLTADISADGMALENGILQGRWPRVDLMAATNDALCPTQPDDMLIARQIPGFLDNAVDVLRQSTGAPPDAECEAITMSVAFRGYAGTFGGLAPTPALPDPCAM